mmetsp:Transcript_63135/g.175021  ORF Transcript_63135/g.175021 Transcript_63135/m.175021 type:complete len:425 (-) Transcript_63135:46-1320(-)|eukprot:CAMPEP_0179072436 /NCGR_PEP_ID=MMETSP0796-20121207/32054_1 /TAXON_ID=73915 /ORGANISM="Pyrodinium bahamense, Strain pbaha01" /LENGTH=424 /DNA_ID=CAMNT_0020769597 /DNA_START=80 /DNA_END=1354 /DNA_ORIENTATION=+
MEDGPLTVIVQLDPQSPDLTFSLEVPANGATVGWVKEELCRQDPTGATSPDSFHLCVPSRPGVPLNDDDQLTAELSTLVLHVGSAAETPQVPTRLPEKGRIWVVIGGADKGGIVSRSGRELSSAQAQARLATGSLVQELAVEGERLHFLRLTGSGPSTGWVSLRLGEKALLEEASQDVALNATEALMKTGGRERWLDILSSRERIALAGDTWYEVLDVFQDADSDVIKRAYRELSLLHHPDKNPDQDDGTFKRVQQAYEEAQSFNVDAATRAKIAALRARVKKWTGGKRSETFIASVDAEEMTEMLLEDSCVVLNVSEEEGMLRDADELITFESLNYLRLRLQPEAFQDRLDSLREDENRVVAVSWTGGRCGEFCALLVDIFGFEADQLCVLHGGIQAWDKWTRDPTNAKMVKKLRQHLNSTSQ